ncbi:MULTISPECIES: hemolysin family protein [Thermoactinomyces]|uniref:hemolysin family protein n=1 Tax=Thermoactinomyces TaxID=2023 RepID=UPI0028683476|nr:hemolysin family protein [Thermoactinomyces vulgaris]
MISIILKLILVLFLVFLNGFFVAAEFAIVKVRATQLANMKGRRAQVAKKVVKNLDAYLSGTQLGITLASLGLGWVGEPAIARMIEPVLAYFGMPGWVIHTISAVIGFLIITFLHIVLGEMAPKSLAIRQSEQTTLWTATPLNWFYNLFKPFIFILNSSANLALKIIGVDGKADQQAHTEEEIRMLIAQSHKSGVIDKTELTLFDNVFDFTERIAREVMVPRVKMVCLFEGNSFEENFEIIKENHHTRFPVCGQDKDDIKGIVHIRDIYKYIAEGEKPDISQIIRPVVVVPETMELKDIFHNLQKNRVEMAIVVDEYGGTSGLLTTEDIIEEIFGEIQDEFDNELPLIQKVGEDTLIDASLLIEDVNEHFNISIEDPDNDTIGGWLFSELDKVPEEGDQVSFDKWVFTVKEMDQLRISRIIVSPLDSKEPHQEDAMEKAPLES